MMILTKRHKLPPAADWRDRNIDDWNVTTFTHYLQDQHRAHFGVEYAPWRGWRVEQGMIANIIGTASGSKPRRWPPAVLREFIDVCFREYRPTPQYPGISFGFMWTYKKNVWQRVVADHERRLAAEEMRADVEQTLDDVDELMEWL